MNELEKILYRLLLAQLQSIGLLIDEKTDVSIAHLKKAYKIRPNYIKWIQRAFVVLDEQGLVTYDKDREEISCYNKIDLDTQWSEWNDSMALYVKNEDARALVQLTDLTLHALTKIITGKELATNVMFPGGTMEYVEGIYKNNKVADYFNEVLADALRQCIESELETQEKPAIRILEIGAGSGGTTALILEKLNEYEPFIKEYCYTDISKAFLDHGKQTYGVNHKYLNFQILDIEKPIEEQGFLSEKYDFIIATNVLHATSNIKVTLEHTRELLKKDGVLFINEISLTTIFNLLTFGMLDGWWKYDDNQLRIPGSPGLYPQVWESVLKECGYSPVLFPASEAHDLGQQIILAQKDRNAVVQTFTEKKVSKKTVPVEKKQIIQTKKANTEDKGEYVQNFIVELVAVVLGMEADDIDVQYPFSEYGMDSIMGTTMIQKINEGLNIELQAIDLFDYTTIEQLEEHILEEFGENIKLPEATDEISKSEPIAAEEKITIPEAIVVKNLKSIQENNLESVKSGKCDIAIVGYSGRFSNTDSAEEFWSCLEQGKDLVRTVERWDLPKEEVTKNVKQPLSNRAALLNDIDKFDPLFFNISGREANYMDPQQRMFLEEAWKAMEHSGYCGEDISGLSCGVYAACGGNDYMNLFDEQTPGQAFWGNMTSATAARLAYYLDLKGPAVAIDTACSSSLVAIHLACQGLWNYEMDMALAGGVAVQCTPNLIVAEERVGMLSPDGKCYTFDERANGFAYGEGVAAVVLKRLDDALRDGDTIHGVIIGSGINQDGATNGLTAPSAKAQESLERKVYDTFGINPAEIQMVEAHGTGTKLGDPIEVQAITKAFRAYTEEKGYCAIGSVKTNIGHTQYAAGVAGVIKVLLSMKHKKIPASINFENKNEKIDFENSPFYVNTQTKKWDCVNGEKRKATVSAFGASGTNAHMVIEEAPDCKIYTKQKEAYMFVLSAKTEKQLNEQAKQLVTYWKTTEETDSGNMSYVLLQGRKRFKYRLSCVASDYKEACNRLEEWLKRGESEGIYTGVQKRMQRTEKAFGEACIEKCIAGVQYKKNLENLAELFVEGYDLSYDELFEGEKHQRIPMPTYPFEKEHHWIENSSVEKKVAKSFAVPATIEEKAVKKDVAAKMYETQWIEADRGQDDVKPEVIVCLLSESENQEEIRQTVSRNSPQTKLVFIKQKHVNSVKAQDVYEIDRQQESDYKEIFGQIAKQFEKISAIAYLWPFEEQHCARDYYVINYILKALADVKLNAEQIIFAGNSTDIYTRSLLDAANGFGSSLSNVLPNTKIYTVIEEGSTDENSSNWKVWSEDIWYEICSLDKKSVRYESGKRYTEKQREIRLEPGKPLLKEGGTYFVTGGAGRLLFELEKKIAKTYHASFVLLGRSELNKSIEEKIEEIECQGGSAIYIQGDVSNRADVVKAVKKAKKIYGNVNGYIHGAGIQGNELILNKSREDMEQVIQPKIDGALVLQEVFETENLDFCCYVSSSSAILGDFGSCDYAIANRFLMSYGAAQNMDNETPVLVVNWPMWKDGNMGFADEDSKKVYLKTSGLQELETKEGIDLWMKLFEHRDVMQCMILKGDASRIDRIVQNAGKLGSVSHETVKKKKMSERSEKSSIVVKDKKKQIEEELKTEASRMLDVPIERIMSDSNFGDFGFDSISLAEYAEILQKKYAVNLSPAVFFSYTTFEKLADYFIEQFGAELQEYYSQEIDIESESEEVPEKAVKEAVKEKQDSSFEPFNEPIAIIGMSGRFPGARNTEQLWSILEQEKSVIDYAPEDRFRNDRDAVKKWKGGWISGVDEFEPLFFEISPKEAEMMDPRHRLLLQETWGALEDAGYGQNRLDNEKVGVFVGAEGGDYRYVSGMGAPITSNHEAVLSARISYFLDLTGPNMTINTACSSSLVAAHQACQSLRLGECDTAIAAGVNLILSSKTLESIGNAGMISPSGGCYAFDERADGMIPAEAVAAVVLKRLSKAERDNDQIYAVIRGSGINYDGKTNGITSPSGLSQKNLMKEVYEQYHINPEDIGYVSAHGTGTRLGDPIEVNALNDAFRNFTKKENYCALSSIKTNIGHSFAASGITGLIGMAKSLEHKKIPASLNFAKRNEYITWEKSPFYVNTKTKEWEQTSGKTRLGAISAFGMSGTNVHMVVEEYLSEKPKEDRKEPLLFVLSAKKENALRKKIEELYNYLAVSKDSLGDIAYTLLEGRHHFEYRCAFVAASKDELKTKLEEIEKKQYFSTEHFYHVTQKPDSEQELENKIRNCDEQTERMRILAEYYCKGMSITWKQLNISWSAKTAHIPSYPFNPKKYWLEAEETKLQLNMDEPKRVEEKIQLEHSEKKAVEIQDTDKLKKMEELLIESLMYTLMLDRDEIDTDVDFITLGLDSIVGVEWIQNLNENLGIQIKADIIYQYSSIHELAKYLIELGEHKSTKQIEEPSETILLDNSMNIESLEEESSGIILSTGDVNWQEEEDSNEFIHLENNGYRATIEEVSMQEYKENTAEDNENAEDISKWLLNQLIEMLALEEDEIGLDTVVADVGLDSILGVEWIQTINKEFNIQITADKIYTYPTIREMSAHIVSLLQEEQGKLIQQNNEKKVEKEETSSQKTENVQEELEALVNSFVTAEIDLENAEQIYKKL